MFEVFGRTGPQNLEGPQFWTVKIPYKLTCHFERLRRLDYGANTDRPINAATRCVLRAYNAAKCDCGSASPPRTPLGELTALPQTPSLADFNRTALRRKGREEKGTERRKRGRGERHRGRVKRRGVEVGTGPPIG